MKNNSVNAQLENDKYPRVAIVHDWLVGGGAELVVYELHRMFPEAPIYTSYCSDEWRERLNGKVVTGFLQHRLFARLRKFLPILRIWWFSRLKLEGYDLVLSSSGAEAKGIKVKKPAIHINYCHAPTHYYWSRYEEYLQNPGFPKGLNWLAKIGLRIMVWPLRKWDYKAAQRPDFMIANSSHTAEQIKKYYNRDSVIIHPPVDIERFSNFPTQKRSGFVTAGRQTPYKRIDLAVVACTKLNLALTVIGNGPDHQKLQRLAGPTITFDTQASDQDMARYFASCEAFIFPTNVEDFGVTPVEAMAAGAPVIAYKAGGPLDYVTPETGLFFTEQSSDSLSRCLESFDSESFDSENIKKLARRFSTEEFHKRILETITRQLRQTNK